MMRPIDAEIKVKVYDSYYYYGTNNIFIKKK